MKDYRKEITRAKRLILDRVMDHIVSHIYEKGTVGEMWKTLSTLYQGTSEQQKMYLEEKLRCIKMQNGEGIDPFLTRIQGLRPACSFWGSTSTNRASEIGTKKYL